MTTPASARKGKRLAAPCMSGAKRASSAGTRLAAVLPRDAVQPARDRVVLVAAEEHAAGLGLAVDEVVGVAEARQVARQLVAVHGRERDVLVLDRDRDERRAGHRRDLRRPHARGVDHDLGLDPARPP